MVVTTLFSIESEENVPYSEMPIFIGSVRQLPGNKAKGRISKRVFQESKARQNFRKTNISYLLIRTCTYAYQGVRNVCFSEILACFAFLKHPFSNSPFCLIPDELRFP